MKKIRIVVGGPPHSGKSTCALYLERALQDLGIDAYNYDYDPFGETKRFAEGLISKKERDDTKKIPTKKEIKTCVKEFTSLPNKLVIGDLPGKPTGLTEILVSGGTHAIILCKDDELDKIKEWEKLFNRKNVKILAILTSNQTGQENIEEENGIIVGKISNLDVSDIGETPKTISAVASLIKKNLDV